MTKCRSLVSTSTGRTETDEEVAGVLLYVSEDVKVVRRHELELEAVEALWIEVKGGESLLVCNVYRPPNANAEWMMWKQ